MDFYKGDYKHKVANMSGAYFKGSLMRKQYNLNFYLNHFIQLTLKFVKWIAFFSQFIFISLKFMNQP